MLLALLVVVGIVFVSPYAYLQHPRFGQLPVGDRLQVIEASPNFADGQFPNLVSTPMFADGSSFISVLVSNLLRDRRWRALPPRRRPGGHRYSAQEERMKFTTTLASLSLLAATGAVLAAEKGPQSQTITVASCQPAIKASAEFFTGNVRIDPLFPAKEAAAYSGAYVTFESGARSAWHTHPTGQHLIVTSGVGWTQEWGGPIVEIRAGDVVWCPPGVKHWHGATPTTAMTHIALTGTIARKNVEWMEKVSDEQYKK